MGYTTSQQGDVTVFDVNPESVPFPFGMIGLAAIPAIIFAFVSWKAATGVVALFAVIAFLHTVKPSALRYRKQASFSVGTEGIAIGGKQIDRRRIHRVIVRNHVDADDDSYSSGVVHLQTGAAGAIGAASSQMGAQAKARAKRKLAAVSYRVDVEAGGAVTTLAGGLNETTAFAVLSDVSNILGMSVS